MKKKPSPPLAAELALQMSDRRLGIWKWDAPYRPPIAPRRSRRVNAILWMIEERYAAEGFAVGCRGRPPLTANLRSLLREGLLTMRRELPGRNILRLSSKGVIRIKQVKIPIEDKIWALRAARYSDL